MNKSIRLGGWVIGMLVFLIAYGVLRPDDICDLSESLISSIRQGLDEHNKVMEWNLKHDELGILSIMSSGF